jgi:lipopolysaccharide transport system permease protein
MPAVSLAAACDDEASEVQELVIRPRSGWIAIDWRELVRARELLYFLTWRDVKIRYKQTALGVVWAVLQPLLTMMIFTVIFGRFARIPSDGVPYPLFVFAGLIPWTFFANGVAQAGASLVNQQQLLTKVYLPRLFIPTAAVAAFLVDLAISFGIYAVMLAFYRFPPGPGVALLPVLVLMTGFATLGLGYALAALTVAYRDFRYVVPFLIQVLMYVSPVIYPVSLVSTRFRLVLALNPMFGLIEAHRWAFLGTPIDPGSLAVSSASTLLLLALGMAYFRRTERRFADIA